MIERLLGRICLVASGAVAFGLGPASAADLKSFPQSQLVVTDFNDGDSFLVRLTDPETGAKREEVIRLYLVDTNEVTTARESDRLRIRQQSRYYGVEDRSRTVEVGRMATEFVTEALSDPFTVHTAFAMAEGRSGKPRYYGFVTLPTGEDLGETLVANGLARAHGVGRASPKGDSVKAQKQVLQDLELNAAMRRVGIWKFSDPGKVVQFREEERADQRDLDSINGSASPGRPIDVNRATLDELMLLPGVGKVIAERIIDGRPYASKSDLLRVKGIGPGTLEKLEALIKTHADQ